MNISENAKTKTWIPREIIQAVAETEIDLVYPLIGMAKRGESKHAIVKRIMDRQGSQIPGRGTAWWAVRSMEWDGEKLADIQRKICSGKC